MRPFLYPDESVQDVIETYLARRYKPVRIICISVIAFAIAAICAMPFVSVDVSVRSPGIIRTLTTMSGAGQREDMELAII